MTIDTRICSEQDCPKPTRRPNHPLCHKDYLKRRDGAISLCSLCGVTYKPASYELCRDCNQKQSSMLESGRSWEAALQQRTVSSPTESDVRAVETVRLNIAQHRELCTNHETNTTQYLVVPLLEGLGWDSRNPAQVVQEYAPRGKRWHGNHKKVDVALFADGDPIVFIEVKRLDREFRDEYLEQLKDYATNLDSGFAVLTNGQHWLMSYVTDGVSQPRETVDVLKGSAKNVARTLNTILGKTRVVDAGRPTPTAPRATRSSGKLPTRKQVMDALKEYRGREAQRRGRPAFTIFSDETIALIAESKPTSTDELQSIKGVGSATLRQHGTAILKIVSGRQGGNVKRRVSKSRRRPSQ